MTCVDCQQAEAFTREGYCRGCRRKMLLAHVKDVLTEAESLIPDPEFSTEVGRFVRFIDQEHL